MLTGITCPLVGFGTDTDAVLGTGKSGASTWTWMVEISITDCAQAAGGPRIQRSSQAITRETGVERCACWDGKTSDKLTGTVSGDFSRSTPQATIAARQRTTTNDTSCSFVWQ
jgi:hypothetical protein